MGDEEGGDLREMDERYGGGRRGGGYGRGGDLVEDFGACVGVILALDVGWSGDRSEWEESYLQSRQRWQRIWL